MLIYYVINSDAFLRVLGVIWQCCNTNFTHSYELCYHHAQIPQILKCLSRLLLYNSISRFAPHSNFICLFEFN